MLKFNEITVVPQPPPKDLPKERDVQISISSQGTLIVSIDGWHIIGLTNKGNLIRYSSISNEVGLKLDNSWRIVEVPENS